MSTFKKSSIANCSKTWMRTTKQDLSVASSNGSRAFLLKETHQTMANNNSVPLVDKIELRLLKARKSISRIYRQKKRRRRNRLNRKSNPLLKLINKGLRRNVIRISGKCPKKKKSEGEREFLKMILLPTITTGSQENIQEPKLLPQPPISLLPTRLQSAIRPCRRPLNYSSKKRLIR